jgi:hypothetical protein
MKKERIHGFFSTSKWMKDLLHSLEINSGHKTKKTKTTSQKEKSVFSCGRLLAEFLELLSVEEEELPGLISGGHLLPWVRAAAVEDDLGMVQKAATIKGASNKGGSHDEHDGKGGGLIPAPQEELKGSHCLCFVLRLERESRRKIVFLLLMAKPRGL